jgi:RNA-dependent RNA polymerase
LKAVTDTGVFIYEPFIVEHFKNSKLVRVPERFIEENFEPETKINPVTAIEYEIQKAAMISSLTASRLLQQHLLAGLTESIVGKYSKFHENAIYMHGYDDPRTVGMAHK